MERTPNENFFEILDAFKALQDEEALGIRRESGADGPRTFLYLRDVASNRQIEDALQVFEQKLQLGRGGGDVEVVFGPYFKNDRTIAMQTMSVMDILSESAAYIIVPEAHVADGRTRANRVIDAGSASRPLLRVYSAADKPKDALVSIRSRDHWFYIDDRDIDSKKAFSFLLIIMQLTSAQQEDKGPAVTIGTG